MEPDESNPRPAPGERDEWTWLNPIVVTALVILCSTLLLIGAGLFGLDKGNVLGSLANGGYARGLITYLFSVGTIGAFVVLILAALVGKGDPAERQERFKNAKDIFALLIGIFGSIVGYYFGTSMAEQQTTPEEPIAIAEPLAADSVIGGGALDLTTYISGGSPPYTYGIQLSPNGDVLAQRSTTGWINDRLYMPPVRQDSVVRLHIGIRDVRGDSARLVRQLVVRNRPPTP